MLDRELIDEFAYEAGQGQLLEVEKLPFDFQKVLRVANGFYTKDRLFRLFGIQPIGRLPSVYEWNQSSWKENYRHLLEDVFIVAEDVFGDQYGYDLAGSLVKVFCEGGERIRLEPNSLEEFLLQRVFVETPNAFDYGLVLEAVKSGLRPSEIEHLAFELPLVTNGEYSVANLQIESPALHLSVLGQISIQVDDMEAGTQIGRFGA